MQKSNFCTYTVVLSIRRREKESRLRSSKNSFKDALLDLVFENLIDHRFYADFEKNAHRSRLTFQSKPAGPMPQPTHDGSGRVQWEIQGEGEGGSPGCREPPRGVNWGYVDTGAF